jgi:hypothetical protein
MWGIATNAPDARDGLISGDCAANQSHGGVKTEGRAGVKNTASLSDPAVPPVAAIRRG